MSLWHAFSYVCATNAPVARRMVQEEGLISAVVLALRSLDWSAKVAEQGVGMMKLLSGDSTFIPFLMAAGSVEMLLSLLERHPKEKRVVVLVRWGRSVWPALAC